MEKVQEFLEKRNGVQQPCFAKRLLAVIPYHQEALLALTSSYSLRVPTWAINNQRLKISGDLLCQTLIQWGFNGLVLGLHRLSSPSPIKSDTFAALETLANLLKNYQLKLILVPETQEHTIPKLADIRQLSDCFQQRGFSSLMIQSKVPFMTHRPKEMTIGDLFEQEFSILQQGLSNLDYAIKLSFPMGYNSVSWPYGFEQSPSFIYPQTQLVFSVTAQDPWESTQGEHPLWSALWRASKPWRCGLLPMIDAGGAGKGGGLWPLATRIELEMTLARCQRHHFIGSLITTATLPFSSSLNALNLQIAGWRLQSPLDSQLSYCQGLERFSKPKPSIQLMHLLDENARMISDVQQFCNSSTLSYPSVGAGREEAEFFLTRLAQLQQKAQAFIHLPQLSYCYRDLRRFVMYELQKRQQPLLKSYLQGEEGEPGFWTEVEGGKMPAGYVASPRIQVLRIPLCGKEASERRHLYCENDLLNSCSR